MIRKTYQVICEGCKMKMEPQESLATALELAVKAEFKVLRFERDNASTNCKPCWAKYMAEDEE